MSIIVSGTVQGVNYRASAKRKAAELGIFGEVSNLSNGDVRITATGTEKNLEEFISWCKHGPPSARVTDVITALLPLRTFEQFSIVR